MTDDKRAFSLTRAQFEAARARLAAEGMSLAGDGPVTIEHHQFFGSVKLTFTYEAAAALLTIEIVHSSFGSAPVWSKVDEWFNQGERENV